METIVNLTNISKNYGKEKALATINLSISKGAIYGLVGQNGAGKSTILRLIAGQSAPSSGNIQLFGTLNSAAARRRIGSLIEQPAFFPNLSGYDNLEYYRIQRGIPEKERVADVIHDLGLSHYADKKFQHYSIGNQQRLGIALALLSNPDFLILDEPINGLDPFGIAEIRRLLLNLNQRKHLTILLSSHILPELEHLINQVGFLHQGKLIEELSMAELQAKCQGHIELKTTRPEETLAILEEKLNISHYQLLPDKTIHIFKAQKWIPIIIKALNDDQLQILSIAEKSQTLEDYFLEMIGGAQND
ncbi:ABC transporter ATP-binding protein [Vagococcus sp. BWB3-3]|uniref:ABC transporter ATP-binding protein n=1 Tax=Vagococcus allomyrinae TaxID=2794353 RepID=A0A940SX00_9ENTE|nr:ABC transporter ATP-binding protein [Vagococcus allomyrinae]MBP1043544.1 ABC transporter ATP-binding protein [Vagococcus allomyrinae]